MALDVYRLDMQARRLSPATLELNRLLLTPFVVFLEGGGITSVDEVTAMHIRTHLKPAPMGISKMSIRSATEIVGLPVSAPPGAGTIGSDEGSLSSTGLRESVPSTCSRLQVHGVPMLCGHSMTPSTIYHQIGDLSPALWRPWEWAPRWQNHG